MDLDKTEKEAKAMEGKGGAEKMPSVNKNGKTKLDKEAAPEISKKNDANYSKDMAKQAGLK